MTDKDFICVLRGCSTNECNPECPFGNLFFEECTTELATHSLDIINRQKAEIEGLRDALIDNEYANCVAVKNGLIYTHTLDDYDKLIGDISAEAIKEAFARLRKRVSGVGVHNAIDCVEKEMVGEDK